MNMSLVAGKHIDYNTTHLAVASGKLTLASANITALGKAHDQNTDTKLAEGTGNEVTAAAIRAFIDSKSQNSGLCPLDSSGKVPTSNLPSIALTDVHVVDDIAERDALANVDEGDVAVVADAGSGQSRSYIYDGSAWVELESPAGAVSSVNGATGTVVLDSGDLDHTNGGTTQDIGAWLDSLLTDVAAVQAVTPVLQLVTLNSTQATNKRFGLSYTPADNAKVRVTVRGGLRQWPTSDFSITTTSGTSYVDWSMGEGMDSLGLVEGDVLDVDYTRDAS